MSYSYPSGPPSNTIFKRLPSDINDSDVNDAIEAPPTFTTGGVPSFLQDGHGQRQADQPYQDYGPAKSMSDVRTIKASVTSFDNRMSNSSYTAAQSLGDMGHKYNSDVGTVDTIAEKSAPGYTGIGPENRSTSDEASGDGEAAGKKYKEVNPTAYFEEDDDEDDD